MTGQVVSAIDQFLTSEACHVVGAFVYGSVATGQAGPTSDVDCFVLVDRPLTPEATHRFKSGFAELQQRLGYCPDVEYPVELFTVEHCRAALAGDELTQAIREVGWHGAVGPDLSEADAVEIFRALLGERITVQASAQLDELTMQARQVLSQHARSEPTLLERDIFRVLGVRLAD